MARGHRQLGSIYHPEGSGGGAMGEDVTVIFTDNSPEVLAELKSVVVRILVMWGIKIEGWAKKLCPVGTPESTGKKGYRGGTLRNSITFVVDEVAQELRVGTNVVYGPYVELGTGPYFEPPPEWENFEVPPSSGVGNSYVRARPFLRPAVTDHQGKLLQIYQTEMKKG